MFSFLKRKRAAAEESSGPLGETSPNISGSQREPPLKRTRLTQMQIDLGGGTNKTCSECGMEYVPANKEDRDLHKEFHHMNIGGVALGKAIVKEHDILADYKYGEVVIAVDAKSSLASRKKAQKVLDVVRSDLGATEISEERLWTINHRRPLKSSKDDENSVEAEEQDPQYKVFMYMAGDRCVGLCLVERITSAYKVVDPETKRDSYHPSLMSIESSSIRAETSVDAMLLGVSRIWTSKSHRKLGVATSLLDQARTNFFYGIEVPKKMVAFSQPTESGGQLARKWFGSDVGWHVYTHSD
jgi:N-acetyltransferase